MLILWSWYRPLSVYSFHFCWVCVLTMQINHVNHIFPVVPTNLTVTNLQFNECWCVAKFNFYVLENDARRQKQRLTFKSWSLESFIYGVSFEQEAINNAQNSWRKDHEHMQLPKYTTNNNKPLNKRLILITLSTQSWLKTATWSVLYCLKNGAHFARYFCGSSSFINSSTFLRSFLCQHEERVGDCSCCPHADAACNAYE